MTYKVEVRGADKEDYPALMEFYNLFVGENRYSCHSSDSFLTTLKSPTNRILVAVKSDKIIGFATVSFRHVVRYPKPIAELDELFVSETYRKQGVGSLLLDSIMREAKKNDCYRLYIESAYAHKAAHELYKKNGFREYGLHFFIGI